MGSHGVTCHPTQVNAPYLTPASKLVVDLTIPNGWKAELTRLLGNAPPETELAIFRSRVRPQPITTLYHYPVTALLYKSDHYPVPDTSGDGVLFSIHFFLSLLAILQENGWTDLHETFREGVE